MVPPAGLRQVLKAVAVRELGQLVPACQPARRQHAVSATLMPRGLRSWGCAGAAAAAAAPRQAAAAAQRRAAALVPAEPEVAVGAAPGRAADGPSSPPAPAAAAVARPLCPSGPEGSRGALCLCLAGWPACHQAPLEQGHAWARGRLRQPARWRGARRRAAACWRGRAAPCCVVGSAATPQTQAHAARAARHSVPRQRLSHWQACRGDACIKVVHEEAVYRQAIAHSRKSHAIASSASCATARGEARSLSACSTKCK